MDPHLVLTKDRENPVLPHGVHRSNAPGQPLHADRHTHHIGLYFYHFDLYTDFRRIYRTPGGEGVLSWTGGRNGS